MGNTQPVCYCPSCATTKESFSRGQRAKRTQSKRGKETYNRPGSQWNRRSVAPFTAINRNMATADGPSGVATNTLSQPTSGPLVMTRPDAYIRSTHNTARAVARYATTNPSNMTTWRNTLGQSDKIPEFGKLEGNSLFRSDPAATAAAAAVAQGADPPSVPSILVNPKAIDLVQ